MARTVPLAPPAARSGVLAAAVVLLGGCAGSTGIGEDPVDPGRPLPKSVPAAIGPVTTRPPTTPLVLDDGSGATVCLGAVRGSAPPACSVDPVPLEGWAWPRGGSPTERDGVRWGRYALTGTFDGTTLAVTGSVPAALYDTVRPDPVTLPPPGTPFNDDALDGIAKEVRGLPGALDVTRDDAGHVLVDVVHDDGTLQAWADQRYSAGVVVLTGALVPPA